MDKIKKLAEHLKQYQGIVISESNPVEPILNELKKYVQNNKKLTSISADSFRAKEMLASTLATIHNQHFIVGLVEQMRLGIEDGTFFDFKAQFMARYYGK
jgi:tRNA-guanine family transglycosylase